MMENFENFGIEDELDEDIEDVVDEFGEVDPDIEDEDDDGIDIDSFDDNDDF
jgi:hypothetical protein